MTSDDFKKANELSGRLRGLFGTKKKIIPKSKPVYKFELKRAPYLPKAPKPEPKPRTEIKLGNYEPKKEIEYVFDTPESIAGKLNTLPNSINKEVIRDLPTTQDVIKEIKALEGDNRIDILTLKNADKFRQKIDMNDQRWHGSGSSSSSGSSKAIMSLSRGAGYGLNYNQTIYMDSVFAATTDVAAGNIIPFAGTISNLYIDPYLNTLDAGTSVFTLMKNGIATSITVSISHGSDTITGDTTHTASVVAGDRINIKAVGAGTSGTINSVGFSYQIS